ncbi:thioredoxin-like protein [Scheffersomyces xylosifermentans]|uniref:thioredoxin-like protein n=1 Tax=Scheffersomyces xylosifermentans TaxID=1304137 RepID=UPI00315DAF87
MDKKQAELVERYQESKLQNARNDTANGDDEDVQSESDDDLLELLGEEDDDLQGTMSQYREARIQQLSKEFKLINDTVKNTNDSELGYVISIDDEKEVMQFVTANALVILHFYQPNFAKCAVMNERLDQLAEKHLTLRVVRIQAEKAPFLVTKLGIKVLPFVAIYKNGNEIDRLVGFEKLGNNPNAFSYEELETYLMLKQIIARKSVNRATIRSKKASYDDDEDDDLDL